MNADVPKEQRRFSRIKFVSASTLWLEGRELEVGLLDIALRGALVDASGVPPVAMGAACKLLLRLDDEQQIEMQGRVAHRNGERIGIECVGIDVDSLTTLRRMLELNLGDPALIDRELNQLFGAD